MLTKTSSTVVIHGGEHRFTVVGHSLVKGNTRVISEPFRVGDYDWAILYYPNGDASVADGQFTSVYLRYVGEDEVIATFSLCLQDPASPVTGEKNKFSFTATKFSPGSRPGKGVRRFVSKADLAASGCLKDDCLVIKCTVEIITSKLIDDREEDDDDKSIVVPPSDLSQDLHNLLESGLEADITIKIGWFKRFKAHRCVLAARSPVFRALLCGSMMESNESNIRVEDMDARVFEVLLHFIYNDSLPEFMDEATEEAINMAQHLLVGADRYAMERLKLICESKLSNALDVNTAGFTLYLADRYHCQQLKDFCLRYMVSNGERLRAIVKTEGFRQLKQNYPLVACEILDKVADKL